MNKHQVLRRCFAPLAVIGVLAGALQAQTAEAPQMLAKPSIYFEVKLPHERLEMTVSTSRILTLEQKIPQAQVNNPDLLDLTVLSPTQIQVSAKKAGFTSINIWDEDKKNYTVDVIIHNDAQELTQLLKSQFPNSNISVVPIASSVLLTGYVDKTENVEKIIEIAKEYYPKVINNMTLGGVQQVLLHVKVMEVSRTKLRRLGVDWAVFNGSNFVYSGASGMMGFTPNTAMSSGSLITNGQDFGFATITAATSFFGVLDAMRKDNLVKMRAEPELVTASGRAASFTAGGEIPVPVPQSLGTLSIEWKKWGAQIDFVPIVLGNGKIRLEVKPHISDLDPTRNYVVGDTTIPGILTREADTAVEMTAGQTMAIAGLLSSREDSENSGLPFISDVPYLGVPFRKVKSETNEIELLILVTPELVEPMDASEVPQCGPGLATTTPGDWDLYMKGHIEVPNCCPNDKNSPPSDGMIGPEAVPAPSGALTPENRPVSRNGSGASAQVARRTSGGNAQNRYSSSKPSRGSADSRGNDLNSPPPFVGPVGYDVIK